MSKNMLQQKIKVLTKLYDCGFTTEKELQTLSLESMLKIPGISITEMSIILELKNMVKTNKLYSYLGSTYEEKNENEVKEEW